jgi:replicative DNA helicase
VNALAPMKKPEESLDAVRLPHDLDVEQAILGCVMYEPSAFARCGEALSPDHFFEPIHGRLWAAIADLSRAGKTTDPLIVAQRFEGDVAFQELGGIGYLAVLVDKAPPSSGLPEYARTVSDLWLRRRVMILAATALKAAAHGAEGTAHDIVSGLRTQIETVEQEAAHEDSGIIEAADAARLAIANMQDMATHGRSKGLLTGLRCIDRRLNGLKPGALVVIGGRPGMSKTGLARAIMHGAATRNPDRVFPFFGIEMGPEEMIQRELSAITYEMDRGIEYRAMSSASLTPMDFMTLADAERRVPQNLRLVDCPALSVDDVRRKVWAMQRKGKVGAICIDYLQLMRKPAAQGRNETSVLGEMTMALKQIARQAGITVILLSQLSRAVEQRDDKRPQLSDLRDSGSIEQDADVVLFPFREFYYLNKAEPKASDIAKHSDWEIACADTHRRLDVICAKQRQGPEGTDRQRYWAEFDHIEDDR